MHKEIFYLVTLSYLLSKKGHPPRPPSLCRTVCRCRASAALAAAARLPPLCAATLALPCRHHAILSAVVTPPLRSTSPRARCCRHIAAATLAPPHSPLSVLTHFCSTAAWLVLAQLVLGCPIVTAASYCPVRNHPVPGRPSPIRGRPVRDHPVHRCHLCSRHVRNHLVHGSLAVAVLR